MATFNAAESMGCMKNVCAAAGGGQGLTRKLDAVHAFDTGEVGEGQQRPHLYADATRFKWQDDRGGGGEGGYLVRLQVADEVPVYIGG
jgi:hypothetical protein